VLRTTVHARHSGVNIDISQCVVAYSSVEYSSRGWRLGRRTCLIPCPYPVCMRCTSSILSPRRPSYVGPKRLRWSLAASSVACCPLASRFQYTRTEKISTTTLQQHAASIEVGIKGRNRQTDRQTDGRTPCLCFTAASVIILIFESIYITPRLDCTVYARHAICRHSETTRRYDYTSRTVAKFRRRLLYTRLKLLSYFRKDREKERRCNIYYIVFVRRVVVVVNSAVNCDRV